MKYKGGEKIDRKIIKALAELEEALVRAGLSEEEASDLVDEIEERVGEVLDVRTTTRKMNKYNPAADFIGRQSLFSWIS